MEQLLLGQALKEYGAAIFIIVIMVLMWWKQRVTEKELSNMSNTAVTSEKCDARYENLQLQLSEIKDSQRILFQKIDDLPTKILTLMTAAKRVGG